MLARAGLCWLVPHGQIRTRSSTLTLPPPNNNLEHCAHTPYSHSIILLPRTCICTGNLASRARLHVCISRLPACLPRTEITIARDNKVGLIASRNSRLLTHQLICLTASIVLDFRVPLLPLLDASNGASSIVFAQAWSLIPSLL